MDLLHLSNHASITCYVPGKLGLWLAKAMWISFYHCLRLCVMAAGFSSWRDPWDHLGGSLPHLHSISYTWTCSIVKTCRAFLAFRIKAKGPTVVSGVFHDLPPHFIFVISFSPTRILAFQLQSYRPFCCSLSPWGSFYLRTWLSSQLGMVSPREQNGRTPHVLQIFSLQSSLGRAFPVYILSKI